MKPIDKSKKSNRRCCNCQHWPGGSSDTDVTCARGQTKSYWNCCKDFAWREDGRYMAETLKEEHHG